MEKMMKAALGKLILEHGAKIESAVDRGPLATIVEIGELISALKDLQDMIAIAVVLNQPIPDCKDPDCSVHGRHSASTEPLDSN